MAVGVKLVEASIGTPRTPPDGTSLEELVNATIAAFAGVSASLISVETLVIPSGKYGLNKSYLATLTFNVPS